MLSGLLQQADNDEKAFEHRHRDFRQQRQAITFVGCERRGADLTVFDADESFCAQMSEPLRRLLFEARATAGGVTRRSDIQLALQIWVYRVEHLQKLIAVDAPTTVHEQTCNQRR